MTSPLLNRHRPRHHQFALAYAPLNGDDAAEALPIQQWETFETPVEVPMLPSFLYLPEDALAQRCATRCQGPRRGLSAGLPGAERRKCQAAWCALPSPGCAIIRRTVPRRSCPGARKSIGPDQKISPVRASALILNHLRRVWNNRFARLRFR